MKEKLIVILKAAMLITTSFFVAFLMCSEYHKKAGDNPSFKQISYVEKIKPISRTERKMISDLIINTIKDGLDGKKIKYPDLKDYPAKWSSEKVVYTTLNIGDKLRSYGGNLNQKKPLLHAILDSAYDAAFNDTIFKKLTSEEFNNPNFNFYISILNEKRKLSFQNERDIVDKLKPFIYGVALTAESENGDKKRVLFLPNVWKKYPNPAKFLKKLKRKAHINEKIFSKNFKVEYFTVETIKDFDFVIKQDSLRIEKALEAYKKLFQPNGRIVYQINFKNWKEYDKNNLVREMGAGYGLSYAYYITHDETLKPLLKNFLNYVKTVFIPDENIAESINNINETPAGASALALLAVLYYEKKAEDASFKDLRLALKNRLISLFEPNVGVHQNYFDNKTSPYYDGETWLALTMYNIFYPEDDTVSGIMPNLNKTMYDKYSSEYLYNFFHWGTQAAAQQFAQNQDNLMYDFLKKQLNIYIDKIDFRAGSSSCAYAEGLGEAALALYEKDEKLYQKVLERFENQLDAVRVLQDIPYEKNKKGKVAYKAKPYLGLFLNNTKSLKTRNDVTQHCLSALLKGQLVFQKAK